MRATSLLAGAALLPRNLQADPPAGPFTSIHLFSKHLQFLDYEPMAVQAARMGFDGVDLTVRPGGHVEPENVARDLPRAAAALRAAGLEPLMCTTAFTSAEDPHFDRTLDAIAAAGFSLLRMGWFRVDPAIAPIRQIDDIRRGLPSLIEALRRRRLNGALQNHAGPHFIGSSLWEYQLILRDVDPSVLGIQFDIRHAVVERGLSWPREVALAAPHIASLVLKDFMWSRHPTEPGAQVTNTPLGEGWVDWHQYTTRLHQHDVAAPTSLHCEYDLGGAEKGRRKITWLEADVYAAIQQDLDRAVSLNGLTRRDVDFSAEKTSRGPVRRSWQRNARPRRAEPGPKPR